MIKNPNQITLRLPDGFRGKIQHLANSNFRSVNSELIFLIERGMQATRSDETPSGSPQS